MSRKVTLIALVCVGLLGFTLAYGAPNTTWDGDTDANWFNANNWDNGAPSTDSNAYLPGGLAGGASLSVDLQTLTGNALTLQFTNDACNYVVQNGTLALSAGGGIYSTSGVSVGNVNTVSASVTGTNVNVTVDSGTLRLEGGNSGIASGSATVNANGTLVLTDNGGLGGASTIALNSGKLVLEGVFIAGSPTDGLLVYQSLNSESGGVVTNEGSLGSAADGTISGDVVITSGGGGKYGEAAQFDGDQDWIDIGNDTALDFGTGDWTVCGWASSTKFGSGDENKNTLVCKGADQSGGHRYQLVLNESTDGRWTTITDDNTTKHTPTSGDVIAADEWHHVVAMRDGTSIKIYVDGVPVDATATCDAGYDLSGTSMRQAYIGASYGTGAGMFKFMQGLIDEVYIYDRALSDGEVTTVMNSSGLGVEYGVDTITQDIEVTGTSEIDLDGISHVTAADLTIDAAATLTIQGAMTFGTVEMGNGSTLTSNGDLAMDTLSLDIDTGITATVNVNSSGTVENLDMEDGVTLAGGDLAATNTNLYGNATFDVASGKTISLGEVIASSGPTIVKNGAGTLELDNATGDSDIPEGTVIQVNQGTLKAAANPVSSLDKADVELGDGTVLDLAGSQLNAGLNGDYHDFTPANDGGGRAGDGWSMMDTLAAIDAWRLANAPDVEQILTGNLDLPGGGGPTGNPFTAIGVDVGEDNIVAFYDGWLMIPTAGDYTFSSQSDDGTVLYLDNTADPLVNNNDFQGYSFEATGTVTLPAGPIPILAGFFEGTGGGGFTFRVESTDAGVTKQPIPSGWYISSFSIADYSDTDVTVVAEAAATMNVSGYGETTLGNIALEANSTLVANLTGPLSMGDLTVGHNTQFDIHGELVGNEVIFENDEPHTTTINVFSPPAQFATVVIPDGGTIAGGDLTFGETICDGSATFKPAAAKRITLGELFVDTATVTNDGPGTLVFNDTSGNSDLTDVAIQVDQGSVEAQSVDGTNAIENSTVTLEEGTTLDLQGYVDTTAPLSNQDVGTPAAAGSASGTAATGYTVTGDGSDIWGTSDNFHYLYLQMAGTDYEINVDVTSGFTGGTNGWSKAGIMVRDNLNGNSRNAAMLFSRDNGASFQWRNNDGDGSGSSHPTTNTAFEETIPGLLKLVREGNIYTGYVMDDPASGWWICTGQHTWPDFSANAYVGLGVTSHQDNVLSTCTFSDMDAFGSVAPADYTGTDVELDGNASITTGQFGAHINMLSFNLNDLTLSVSGDLIVEETELPDGTTIDVNSSFRAIDGTIDTGDTFKATGTGTVAFDTLNVYDQATLHDPTGIVTVGNLEINDDEVTIQTDAGTTNLGMITDYVSDTVLTKTGAGTLKMTGPSAGGDAQDTTIDVTDGVLQGATTPTESGFGDLKLIQLDGGDLELASEALDITGLAAGHYTGTNQAQINVDGATYQINLDAPMSGDSGILAIGPSHTAVETGNINYQDNFGNLFAGLGRYDNASNLWSGQMVVPESGDWTFRWSNDDWGSMYIDTDANGVFDADELLAPVAWDGTGTVNLTAGQVYNVAMMSHENGGGETAHFWVQRPGYPETFVNPTLQDPMWTTKAAGTPYGTDIEVVDNASITVLASRTPELDYATIGNLNISEAVTLDINGNVFCADLEMLGGSQVNVNSTLQANGDTYLYGPGTVTINTVDADDKVVLEGPVDDGGGDAVTVHKIGAGRLELNDLTGGSALGDTTIKITEGTVLGQIESGNSSLGNYGSDDDALIELNGGELELTEDVVFNDGIRGSIFLNQPRTSAHLDLSGGTYVNSLTRVFTGDKAGTILTDAEDPGNNVLITANANIQNWNQFPGFSPPDDFVTAFSGYFVPGVAGDNNYNFRWSNDDRGWMWLDRDQNGVFDSGESIGSYNGNSNGNVTLTGGERYAYMFFAQEHAGGQSVNWYYNPAAAGEVRVNPGAQAGQWQYLVKGLGVYNNDVNLTASSTITVEDAGEVQLGHLNFADGNTLTTAGSVHFHSTNFQGASAIYDTTVAGTMGNVGVITKQPGALLVTKNGPGGMGLNDTTVDANLADTTIHITGGVVSATHDPVSGQTSLGQTALVKLDGGNLSLTGEAVKEAKVGGPVTAGLKAWYRFDEAPGGQGTTMADELGNFGDAVAQTGSRVQAGGLFGSNCFDADGGSSGAGYDNGARIPMFNTELDMTKDHTIMMWYNMDTKKNWARVFDNKTHWNTGGDGAHMAFHSNDNRLHNRCSDGGSSWDPYLPVHVYDTWKMLTWVYHPNGDGSTATIYCYLDDGSGGQGTGWEVTTNFNDIDQVINDMAIGSSPYNEGGTYDGSIDDLRFYDRCLSAAEVAEIYGWDGTMGGYTGPETIYEQLIEVWDDAGIEVEGDVGIIKGGGNGGLVFKANAELDITGGSAITFEKIKADTDANEITIDAEIDAYSLVYQDTNKDTIVTKTGSASLIFEMGEAGLPPQDAHTTFDIQDGYLVVDANTALSPLPWAEFKINGGGLVVTSNTAGNDITFAHPDTSMNFEVVSSGSIEARLAGMGVNGPITVTLPNDIEIPGGATLTFLADNDYTLLVDANIFGDGGIATAGPSPIIFKGELDTNSALTVTEGSLTIWDDITSPSEIIVDNAGQLDANGNVYIAGNDPGNVTIIDGTMNVVLDLEANDVVVQADGILDVDGNTLVTSLTNNGGQTTLTGPVTTTGNTVTVSGGTVLVESTLDSPAVEVNTGGQITIVGTCTVPDITVNDGTFLAQGTVDANNVTVTGNVYSQGSYAPYDTAFFTVQASSLALDTMMLTGGTSDVSGNIDANALSITSSVDPATGRAVGAELHARGILTVPADQFTLASRGRLYAHNANTMSGLPDFTMAGQAELYLEAVQASVATVTIEAGSALIGQTNGLTFRGANQPDTGEDIVFHHGAIFGADPGQAEPTTTELGEIPAKGAPLQLVGAIIGGAQNFKIHNDENAGTTDDIYMALSYGRWTDSKLDGQVDDVSVAQTGIDVYMNETDASLNNTSTWNTGNTDPAQGVRFLGTGNLTILANSVPAGASDVWRRDGDANMLNRDMLTLQNNTTSGRSFYATSGRVELTHDTSVAFGSHLYLQEAATTILDGGRRPSQGSIHVEEGGMVWVDNADRLTNGAAFTWDEGSLLAYRTDNFDPHATGQWPHNVHFVCDMENYDLWTGGGLQPSEHAWFIGRQSGNSRISGDSTGVKAYATGAAPGQWVGIGCPAGVNYYLEDPFDLTWGGDEANVFDIVVGSQEPMWTVVGNNDRTRVKVPMTGIVRAREVFKVGQVNVRGGELLADFDRGLKIWESDSIYCDHGYINLHRMNDDNNNWGIDGLLDIRNQSRARLNGWDRQDVHEALTADLSDPNLLFDSMFVGDESCLYIRLKNNSDNNDGTVPVIDNNVQTSIIQIPITITGRPFHRYWASGALVGWDFRQCTLDIQGGHNDRVYLPDVTIEADPCNPGTPTELSVGVRDCGNTTNQGGMNGVQRGVYMNIMQKTDIAIVNHWDSASESFSVIDWSTDGNQYTVMQGGVVGREPYQDDNGNNSWQDGEAYVDLDGDGEYDQRDWLSLTLYGHIDNITIDQTCGGVYTRRGFSMGPNTVIMNRGNYAGVVPTGWAGGPDGFISIFNAQDGNENDWLSGGLFVVDGGQDIRLNIDEHPTAGQYYVSKLITPVEVRGNGGGVLQGDRYTDRSGGSVAWFSDVQAKDGAVINLDSIDGCIVIPDITLDGGAKGATANIISSDNYNNCWVGDVDGNGTLIVGQAGNGNTLSLVGSLDGNADMEIDGDLWVVRVRGEMPIGSATHAGGFRLGGRTLTIKYLGLNNNVRYAVELWPEAGHVGEGTIRLEGEQDGQGNTAVLEVRAGEDGDSANYLDANADIELAGGTIRTAVRESTSQLVNVIGSQITVIGTGDADNILTTRKFDGADDGDVEGVVIYENIAMGSGNPVLYLETDGITYLEANTIDVDSNGTIVNDHDTNRILIHDIGVGTAELTLDGTQPTRIDGNVVLDGIVFNQTALFQPGSSLDANYAVFNAPMTFDANYSADFDDGTVNDVVTLDQTAIPGPTSWLLNLNGDLIARGLITINDGDTFDFNGGQLTILEDGDNTINIPMSVQADSRLRIGKLNAGGPDGNTFSFETLTLTGTADPTMTLSSINDYKYEFDGLKIDADGGIALETPDMDANFGDPVFGGDATLRIDAAAGVEVALNPIDSNGFSTNLRFGEGAVNGGSLVLSNSPNWDQDGNVYVSNGWLKIDELLTTFPCVEAQNGGIDVGVNQEMGAWAAGSLRLRSSMQDCNAPTLTRGGTDSFISGELIIATPVVWEGYKRADGNPIRVKESSPTAVWSETADANFAAPIDITGQIEFGNAGGGGQNFTMGGSIGGTGGVKKVGAETVTFANNNSYGGNTAVDNGTLRVTNPGAWGSVGSTSIADGGTFEIDANANISYGQAVSNDGHLHVQSGNVDLGTTVITSTQNTLGAVTPGLLAGILKDRTNWQTVANPGNLGLVRGPEGALFGNGAAGDPYDANDPWHSDGAGGTATSDNTTLIYTGQILLPAGEVSFAAVIDDDWGLKIEGQPDAGNAGWNVVKQHTITVPAAGWYDIDIRLSNGSGGYGLFGGATTGNQQATGWLADPKYGFGFKLGAGSTTQADFIYTTNSTSPGDVSWFRQQPVDIITGNITVDANTSLSLGGFTNAGTVSVDGTMTFQSTDSDCVELLMGDEALIDVNDATITIARGSLSTIAAEVREGWNGGGWDGDTGITSSLATDPDYAVGVFENEDGSVIVGLALMGDITMDGIVDYDDYEVLKNNYGATNANWALGDYDYDLAVTWKDYVTLKTYWGLGGPPAGGEIPEPATLVLLTVGAAGLVLRRRRRK